MNTRAFTLALIIATLAAIMVNTYIDDKETEITQQYGTKTTVVIAKKDIGELELIDDSKVTIRSVPKNFKMPGSFSKMTEVENTVATVPILKGEQITKPRITHPGARTGLARQVSVGKRAVAIQITENQAVSKLLKPGDRVDVLASINYAPGRKDLQKIKTILQDVLVLSTGMSMTNSIPIYGVKVPGVIKTMKVATYTKYNTVTLELDPYEAQKLVYLLTYSGVPPYLTLRNNNDKKVERIRGIKIFDVLGAEDTTEAKSFFNEKNKGRGVSGR